MTARICPSCGDTRELHESDYKAGIITYMCGDCGWEWCENEDETNPFYGNSPMYLSLRLDDAFIAASKSLQEIASRAAKQDAAIASTGSRLESVGQQIANLAGLRLSADIEAELADWNRRMNDLVNATKDGALSDSSF